MQPRVSVLFLVALAVVVAASPALPQADFFASYAGPHLFALPNSTTTRLFGMGGFVTCVKDAGFANPAYAGTLAAPQGVARTSRTDFDRGLRLEGWQASFAWPLRPNESGLQVTYFNLDSNQGTILTLVGPLQASLEERDLAVHYGRRLSDKWVVGLGLSPVLETETNYLDPGSMASQRLQSDADFGFRLGGLYQTDEAGWVGFVYDRYDEDVNWSGTMLGAGTASFRSEEMALGVSRQVADNVLAAIEWQQLTTEGLGVKVGDSGLRLGAEVVLSESWAVRAGWNDGAFSLGSGWTGDDWSVQYAFINDWNDDSVGAALGGSHTHQFSVRRHW